MIEINFDWPSAIDANVNCYSIIQIIYRRDIAITADEVIDMQIREEMGTWTWSRDVFIWI